ncbi:MAG: AIM24 family protein [Lachnospiraceae bacterium]|nr:AIM24 family protein [Lachnospiraceae bacterium]
MFKTNIFEDTEDHHIINNRGCFSVVEYTRDISVSPETAVTAYFSSQMNVRKKQLIADLKDGAGVIMQAGEMQLMMGNIMAKTDVRGAGDLMKKFVGSRVTGETTIKPVYSGDGIIVSEPTFKYIILIDLDDFNNSLIVEDGMFLACEDTIDLKVKARDTISSAVLGKEGLFNSNLKGRGVVALESSAPYEELLEVKLENDVLKVDGDMAIAWSGDLSFTVERVTPTLIGSMASGEGLVNVYRGTGKVLVAPVSRNKGISHPEKTK